MNKGDLTEWYKYYRQYVNGYHMEKWDWDYLVRFNHIIMEVSIS